MKNELQKELGQIMNWGQKGKERRLQVEHVVKGCVSCCISIVREGERIVNGVLIRIQGDLHLHYDGCKKVSVVMEMETQPQQQTTLLKNNRITNSLHTECLYC